MYQKQIHESPESLSAFPESTEHKAIRLYLLEEIPFEIKHRDIPKLKQWFEYVKDSCAANVLEDVMIEIQHYPLINETAYWLEKISRQTDAICKQLDRILKGE